MNVIFLLGFPVLLLCSTAQGIICRVCDSGNGKGCYEKEETCKTYSGQCYSYASYLDGDLYFLRYTCIYSSFGNWFCNRTTKADPYVRVSSCCTTDKWISNVSSFQIVLDATSKHPEQTWSMARDVGTCRPTTFGKTTRCSSLI